MCKENLMGSYFMKKHLLIFLLFLDATHGMSVEGNYRCLDDQGKFFAQMIVTGPVDYIETHHCYDEDFPCCERPPVGICRYKSGYQAKAFLFLLNALYLQDNAVKIDLRLLGHDHFFHQSWWGNKGITMNNTFYSLRLRHQMMDKQSVFILRIQKYGDYFEIVEQNQFLCFFNDPEG